MKTSAIQAPEHAAEQAFSRQAPIFDQLYGGDRIVQYKRKRVRDHVLGFLPSHSSILELNAGTGEDAIFFAKEGHEVHATDISGAMQEILAAKVRSEGLEKNISQENCSFLELDSLNARGPYDLIFSNFAGLNCTNELEKVFHSFSSLLKPGGWVTLVILPKFCLWESLLLFKGKFKTAFRRFSGKRGTIAKVEGMSFRCWYYNPSSIRRWARKEYKTISQEGLCTIVPPSYIEHFAEKYPGWFQKLESLENSRKKAWPWKNVGDYFIITLQKNGELP